MADRSNLWCCIIYPNDSCPKNYKEIIGSWLIPCLLSPIHDKDLNAYESEKKQHQHLLIYFGKGANKSFEQVKKYTDQLKGTIPIIVNSRNSMIRYFIHKDNPEKVQYSVNDLIPFAGFEYLDAFENYTSDQELYVFIEDLIRSLNVTNIVDLRNYMFDHHYEYELMFLRKHTLWFKALIDSNWLKNNRLRYENKV